MHCKKRYVGDNFIGLQIAGKKYCGPVPHIPFSIHGGVRQSYPPHTFFCSVFMEVYHGPTWNLDSIYSDYRYVGPIKKLICAKRDVGLAADPSTISIGSLR